MFLHQHSDDRKLQSRAEKLFKSGGLASDQSRPNKLQFSGSSPLPLASRFILDNRFYSALAGEDRQQIGMCR
jgi:hypothetical protein